MTSGIFEFVLVPTVLLLGATVALSIAQAWAITGERRLLRHLLVWVIATATVPSVYTWQGGIWNMPMPAALLGLGTPAALFGVALGMGARRARAKGLAAQPWAKRVVGLTGAHLGVVFFGGALVLVVGLFLLLVLNPIH
jgi:hypothetical protein